MRGCFMSFTRASAVSLSALRIHRRSRWLLHFNDVLWPSEFMFCHFLNQVGSKMRGESFGELALMTMSPRAATVIVSSHSARIFSLEREEFQNFVVLSGVLADQNSKNAFAHQSVPEPPDLPLHYMVVPKVPPYHPNCAVLLPQPELARSPVIELSVSGQTFGSRTSTVTSSTLVTYRGLLLQPWPEALNDTMVDVLGDFPYHFLA